MRKMREQTIRKAKRALVAHYREGETFLRASALHRISWDTVKVFMKTEQGKAFIEVLKDDQLFSGISVTEGN